MKLALSRQTSRMRQRARVAVAGSLAAATVVAGLAVAVTDVGFAPASDAAAPAAAAFASDFADPPVAYQPKTRVWWGCGNISTADIQSQFQSIKDGGFSGVEIICFSSAPQYGWGSATLNARMQDALTIGEDLGLTVDWTVSGSWPLNVPGVGADDAASAKEMVQGTAVVNAGQTFNAAVPEPNVAPTSGVTQKELLAVQAVQCQTDCTGSAPVGLVPGTLVDLTSQVSGGNLTWTAPNAGTWLLMSSWQRGTGQLSVVYGNNNVSPGVVVDHFSRAGADAGIDYWNDHVLTPQMRASLQAVGGDIFEDSLELDSNFHWTPGFLDEFEERRGYDLRPYLPVLVVNDIHQQYSPVQVTDPARYSLSPAEDRRVRRDYYQTLTDLYRENHMDPLRDFAASLGMEYRAQAYGTTTDFSALSLDMDIVEGEGLADSLAASPLNRVDEYYRTQTASVNLTDKTVMSSECCAIGNSAYAVPWEDQIARFNGAYVGGVNQIVLHGVAQQTNGGQKWPGWSPFTSQGGNGYSEAQGPRMPSWGDVSKVTDWMGRMQYALRSGQEKVDVAVFRDVMGHGHPGVSELSADGYTYEYLSPAHLQLDSATVKDGVLAPDTAAYQSLVIAEQDTMSLDSAQRILAYAQAGLPVVIVGDLPSNTPGRDGNDAALATTLTSLVAKPSVERVTDVSGLAAALDDLGADPAVTPATPSKLMTAHHAVADGDLYLAWNPTASTINRVVTLDGTGAPAALDAWTGDIRPVGAYRRVDGDHVQIKVSLKPGESALYGIGTFTTAPAVHVDELIDGVTTTADGTILVAGTETGTYTAKLSNGQEVSADITQVGAAKNLTGWDLDVEDWHRNAALDLEKTQSSYQLGQLKPWSQIPGLEDTSGIGTYRTTVNLPQTWTGGRHAMLDLGTVTDTFDVTINGRHVDGIDQTLGSFDASDYLQRGENTIEVRVATQLRNRLRVTAGFPNQATQARQDYGLIGPVTLQPYGQVQIWSKTPEAVTATAAPTVTGQAQYGRALQATAGTWSTADLTYAYQWLRNGQAIPGQTAATLKLDKADVGARISVRVSATSASGTGTSTSTATPRVAKAGAAVSISVRKRAKKGQAVAVRIRVSSPTAVANGRMVLRLNGKAVRTINVKPSATQSVKVALKKRGVSKLRVFYAGTPSLQAARSRTAVVRVR